MPEIESEPLVGLARPQEHGALRHAQDSGGRALRSKQQAGLGSMPSWARMERRLQRGRLIMLPPLAGAWGTEVFSDRPLGNP